MPMPEVSRALSLLSKKPFVQLVARWSACVGETSRNLGTTSWCMKNHRVSYLWNWNVAHNTPIRFKNVYLATVVLIASNNIYIPTGVWQNGLPMRATTWWWDLELLNIVWNLFQYLTEFSGHLWFRCNLWSLVVILCGHTLRPKARFAFTHYCFHTAAIHCGHTTVT